MSMVKAGQNAGLGGTGGRDRGHRPALRAIPCTPRHFRAARESRETLPHAFVASSPRNHASGTAGEQKNPRVLLLSGGRL